MKPLRYLKRLFDNRPMACDIYVTDRCDLDCAYCTEHSSKQTDPDVRDLMKWCRRVRELGCLHIGLQGGEPLLHPFIVDIVAYCKLLGMSVSLSTNGLSLSEGLAGELGRAGLDTLRISIDRMWPTRSTQKAFTRLADRLDVLRLAPYKVVIDGVLFADTLSDCDQVLDGALDRGCSAHFQTVRPGSDRKYHVPQGDRDRVASFLDEMKIRKIGGQRIHTSRSILEYQRRLLSGDPVDWTCAGGYKHFSVSSTGEFRHCSKVSTGTTIMDITPRDLARCYRRKQCQENCGDHSVVEKSMLYQRPLRFLLNELGIGIKWPSDPAGPYLTIEEETPPKLEHPEPQLDLTVASLSG